MGLRRKIQQVVDKAALKAIDLLVKEREEDSVLDLKVEQMEGRAHVERPIVPVDETRPVFRRDGQVHSFDAAPWPGQRRLTRAQYDARYGGARPEPRISVAPLAKVVDEPLRDSEVDKDLEDTGEGNYVNERR